jgi:hypothetical protein
MGEEGGPPLSLSDGGGRRPAAMSSKGGGSQPAPPLGVDLDPSCHRRREEASRCHLDHAPLQIWATGRGPTRRCGFSCWRRPPRQQPLDRNHVQPATRSRSTATAAATAQSPSRPQPRPLPRHSPPGAGVTASGGRRGRPQRKGSRGAGPTGCRW